MTTFLLRMSDERNIIPTKSVCRCLFGQPDHEETKKWLDSQLEDQRKVDEEKWNFDAERGVPLPGKWEWEKIDSNSNIVPSAYDRMGVQQNSTDIGSNNVPTVISAKDNKSDITEPNTPITNTTTQSRITDFLKVKKRRSTSNVDTSKRRRTSSPLNTPTPRTT